MNNRIIFSIASIQLLLQPRPQTNQPNNIFADQRKTLPSAAAAAVAHASSCYSSGKPANELPQNKASSAAYFV
jgi:hypothetical protein